MKHRPIFILAASTAITVGGCASNRAARNAAAQVRASVAIHEKVLDAKISEQQAYYDARRQAVSATRKDSNDDSFDTARRIRAAQIASRMSIDPEKEVRIGPLLDYLASAVEEDFATWRQHRDQEAAATKGYETALQEISRHTQALAEVRKTLDGLMSKASRNEQIKAAADFAQQVKSDLDKQAQQEQANARKK